MPAKFIGLSANAQCPVAREPVGTKFGIAPVERNGDRGTQMTEYSLSLLFNQGRSVVPLTLRFDEHLDGRIEGGPRLRHFGQNDVIRL